MGGVRSLDERSTDGLGRVRVASARVGQKVEPGALVGCQATDGTLTEVTSNAAHLGGLGTVHSTTNVDDRALDFTNLIHEYRNIKGDNKIYDLVVC